MRKSRSRRLRGRMTTFPETVALLVVCSGAACGGENTEPSQPDAIPLPEIGVIELDLGTNLGDEWAFSSDRDGAVREVARTDTDVVILDVMAGGMVSFSQGTTLWTFTDVQVGDRLVWRQPVPTEGQGHSASVSAEAHVDAEGYSFFACRDLEIPQNGSSAAVLTLDEDCLQPGEYQVIGFANRGLFQLLAYSVVTADSGETTVVLPPWMDDWEEIPVDVAGPRQSSTLTGSVTLEDDRLVATVPQHALSSQAPAVKRPPGDAVPMWYDIEASTQGEDGGHASQRYVGPKPDAITAVNWLAAPSRAILVFTEGAVPRVVWEPSAEGDLQNIRCLWPTTDGGVGNWKVVAPPTARQAAYPQLPVELHAVLALTGEPKPYSSASIYSIDFADQVGYEAALESGRASWLFSGWAYARPRTSPGPWSYLSSGGTLWEASTYALWLP